MNGKKIIVPKGENPLKFLKEVKGSDAIIYFHSRLLNSMEEEMKIISNAERLIVKFHNQELVFLNGYNMVYHQLLKIGDKSYAPIRKDKRDNILFVSGE